MGALADALAARIAPVVVANLATPYPYHDSRLFTEAAATADPATAHPAFGNAYDWHSSVHSHWTAMQLLAYDARRREETPLTRSLQALLEERLTPENIAAETAHLVANPWYERPYGRAWALALTAACAASPVAAVQALYPPLRAMAEFIAAGFVNWVNILPAPVRHGVHSNTAFALGLALDAARTLEFDQLAGAIATRAHAWFGHERDYPQAWERSGHDFVSAGLAEADLMRRVQTPESFAVWWRGFLGNSQLECEIFSIASVPDVADGQIVHLHGLNLSRAGMLARIALRLGPPSGTTSGGAGDARALLRRARQLYAASAGHAFGSDYLSTHWLPTFAWDAAASIDAAD